jgi:Glycosyltransferase family 87
MISRAVSDEPPGRVARGDALAGPRTPRLELLVLIGLAAAATLWMLWTHVWDVRLNDYGTEAAAPMSALLHGRFKLFFQLSPPYGPSLVFRAPFALPASLAGGSRLMIYRFSALPCAAALGALGVWCATRLRLSGAGVAAALLALAACVLNPLSYYALLIGHPEELLGGVLCVAAVLAAIRGHSTWAGLLLGAAIANKEWALVAVGPVLLALPTQRIRTTLIAAGFAGIMLAPIALVSGDAKLASSRITVNDTGLIFYPQQLWWFFGPVGHWVPAMLGQLPRGFRLPPTWLQGRAHLLIVWIGLPLTLIAVRRKVPRENAVLLLAMLLLLRCMLDPWDLVYYPLPFVIALATWESTVKHRAPIAAVLASIAGWAIFEYLPNHLGLNEQALAFIIPSLIALAVTAVSVYRRPTSAPAAPSADAAQSTTSNSLVNRLNRRAPLASTTAKSSIRTPSLPGR